ncbi:MAG: 4'-phosphopantetheinyl transferase superfamily protein [Bacteroidales bacterium]|nr:4'-phosphopantetheinyl transferase superfamily protein [Bacteroidales bacterium]
MSDHSLLAFWKMEESEEQLRAMCDLCDEDLCRIDNCKAPKRRIELLSVRALLKAVGINQTIHYNDSKPYLDNGYISISHSADIAAIIYNPDYPVGIDIEKISPRIQRIATRAFSDEEIAAANGDLEKLTILWNCKECVFKLADDEGIDFREMISIQLAEMSPETPSETPPERQSKGSRNGSIIEVSRGLSEGLIDATLTKSGKTRHFSLSSMKIEDNTVVWGHLVF